MWTLFYKYDTNLLRARLKYKLWNLKYVGSLSWSRLWTLSDKITLKRLVPSWCKSVYHRKVFKILDQAPSTAGGKRKHVKIKVTYFNRENVKIPLASISPNDYAKSEKSESGR